MPETPHRRDLAAYGLLVFAPAALITAAGLYFLHVQNSHDKIRARESYNAHVSARAGELQDSIRDAGTDDAKRTNSLAALVGEGTPPATAAFVWNPKSGLVWERGLGEGLARRISGFAHWSNWKSPSAKTPRRGLMEIADDAGTGWFVLWGRVDGALYGLVYAVPPVVMQDGSWLWLAGACLGVMLCGILVAGGLMLGRAAKNSRAADAMKTAFLSNVSHELKTPLAAIRIWADMLATGRLASEEKRQHALDVIVEENGRMIRMVENLLDFARLARRRRKYALGEVDLAALARETVEFMGGAFSDNGISCEGAKTAPATADADAVRQILVNLVGNAAKYAAADGPVTVVVEHGDDCVRVTVADRGPGMAKEAMARAFERFYRADEEAPTADGLGLGLSISRALARDMGGEVYAAAREGGGMAFTLSLPAYSS